MQNADRKHSATHRHFDFRGFITYSVLLSFIVMLASGVVMFLAPSGRVAGQTDWSLLGLDRARWQTLHLSFAVVFVVAGLVHLTCNWRGLLHHLRERTTKHVTLKWEAVLALAAVVWLIASAAVPMPPASTLHGWNEYFRKTFWAGAPPAQESTTAPSSVEAASDDAMAIDPALPEGHPVIDADEACSDCHRQ